MKQKREKRASERHEVIRASKEAAGGRALSRASAGDAAVGEPERRSVSVRPQRPSRSQSIGRSDVNVEELLSIGVKNAGVYAEVMPR